MNDRELGVNIDITTSGNMLNADINNKGECINALPMKLHPWRRLFARIIDEVLGGAVMGVVLVASVGNDRLLRVNQTGDLIVMGMLGCFLWIPVEALFISALATTPAKWVFGISVLDLQNNRLTYKKALLRTWYLFFYGEGFCFPLITPFTRFISYRQLNKTGSTLWDNFVSSRVSHKNWGVIRAFAASLSAILILCLEFALSHR